MKHCKPRSYEYTGINGVITETQFVTYKDIESFHGADFAAQWKTFAGKLVENKFGESVGYYYYDYKNLAITTKMWLDS